MLGWALTFLILALVAGYMGFFGLAGLAATIAKLLLVVFLILLIVSAFSGAPIVSSPSFLQWVNETWKKRALCQRRKPEIERKDIFATGPRLG